MLIGVVPKLCKLFGKLLLSVALNLVIARHRLGHAHAARHVQTENNTDVLASYLLVFDLGSGFDQIVNNVGFGDFFVFK